MFQVMGLLVTRSTLPQRPPPHPLNGQVLVEALDGMRNSTVMPHRPTVARRAIALLAAVVLAVVAALTLTSGPAVADNASLPATRVAAANFVGSDGVEPGGHITPGEGRETGVVSYDLASGSRVATRAIDDVPTRPGTAITRYEPYPPADLNPRGFAHPPVREALQPGTTISRYGHEGGAFASPAGTPFEARGLPPAAREGGESLYTVARPIDADAGIAAYWQGGGGGIQYELPNSVRWLRENGFLKPYEP